ncbi:1-acyl-sn-glycerol-3-phosphate acyltransferase [Mycobacterium hodleri]|uniref:1-acyl-sn-glycerol-3-phosphate acyltransferase n=1 Tax=Mycolicibacterium hodleri TaxID=49897 RepID=UPI0021F3582F|nr:1-acyl-sn-glycerol-3-phosphate acyltransferase [Mycolicibacterium hodleri]MCV7135218.1 1-acyl-sn-glycerol-3-phosphate acyltransferase [Mycolicibacterium hodleri]
MPEQQSPEHGDAENLVDALLAAYEEGAEKGSDGEESSPDLVSGAAFAFRRLAIEFVRRYNRLEVTAEFGAPNGPVLFVANHGFGGIFDLNVFAVGATFEGLKLDRDVTILTHQVAWTLGVGRLIEPLGARPASTQSAQEAFGRGEHVAVFPGGDLDAAKAWEERNLVKFGGRAGFARLAIDEGVPIVPIVTAGAGESLIVLSSGERLARAIRLDKLLRVKSAPVSVSLPWGLSIGAVGMLPYLPLPTKLVTRVLPAMLPTDGEDAADFALRVETAMQNALTEMTTNRVPLIG